MRLTRGVLVAVWWGAVAGCAPGKELEAPAGLALGAPRVHSGPEAASISAMTATSPGGVHVYAWVEGRGGDADTRLFVATDSGPARPVDDSAGVPAGDPETPPKIGFGPAGAIHLVYTLTKTGEPHKGWSSLRSIRSTDGGRTWSAPVAIADDGEWGRYRYDHAFHVAPDGSLHAAWLDLRDSTKVKLYSSRSTDGGASWAANTPIDLEGPCECCRVSIASAPDGRLFVAWRKILPGSLRDIVVASSRDSGATWSAPVRAHADDWKIDGCPDAGPSLLANPDGVLHLAWWTGKDGAAGVKVVTSPDGGATWRAPVALKVAAASQPSHVQLARTGDGTLYVTWEDGTLKEPKVLLAASHDDGATFGAPIDVSVPGVRAGYPVLAVAPKELVVAWHQADPAVPGKRQFVSRSAGLP